VGASVTQTDGFSYIDADCSQHAMTSGFPGGAFVLLADDFTNSGSTLFGGAEIIRRHAKGKVSVHGYVTHYVAKYDRETVSKFVAKLYGGDSAPLDEFHCTDSIPNVIAWLKEDVKIRVEAGMPAKAHVMQLAPLIGDWIKTTGAKNIESAQPTSSSMASSSGLGPVPKVLAVLAAGVALGMALGRSR
jgi:phosphoribosylpyrophosphate synthetase